MPRSSSQSLGNEAGVDCEQVDGNGTVIKLRGVLLRDGVLPLLKQLASCLRKGQGDITLDLDQVTAMDSAGLALLVEVVRQGRDLGRLVHVVALPEQIKPLATLTGLDQILQTETS
jgi:phospholipid transport system transporter-binding protein